MFYLPIRNSMQIFIVWLTIIHIKQTAVNHSPVSWPWRHRKEVKWGAETVWLCPPQSPLSLYTRPLLSAHAHWPPVAGRSVVPTLCWWKKDGITVANVASRWVEGLSFDGGFCRRRSKLSSSNSDWWLFFNSDVDVVEKPHGFDIVFEINHFKKGVFLT